MELHSYCTSMLRLHVENNVTKTKLYSFGFSYCGFSILDLLHEDARKEQIISTALVQSQSKFLSAHV